jgi:ubiquinone biosynthesis protein UbiJ
MDKKTFFDNIRKEANIALSKVFDKVEEVSKTSALRLKISNLKGQIRDIKTEIGHHIHQNPQEFSHDEAISTKLEKIERLEEEIELKLDQINDLKEKEEEGEEEEPESFSL